MMTEAVKKPEYGIRGYYFALAAFFLFVGPYAGIHDGASERDVHTVRDSHHGVALTLCRWMGHQEVITLRLEASRASASIPGPIAARQFFCTIQNHRW